MLKIHCILTWRTDLKVSMKTVFQEINFASKISQTLHKRGENSRNLTYEVIPNIALQFYCANTINTFFNIFQNNQ